MNSLSLNKKALRWLHESTPLTSAALQKRLLISSTEDLLKKNRYSSLWKGQDVQSFRLTYFLQTRPTTPSKVTETFKYRHRQIGCKLFEDALKLVKVCFVPHKDTM